ncbi:flagellar M-ring protein FliF [Oscillospiraceae bacterium OttesenSCG-928-G22]|nr:flagellar M-ring protein FliF [Oscillospiraceae bacterium OttesenSCG-928-G22]
MQDFIKSSLVKLNEWWDSKEKKLRRRYVILALALVALIVVCAILLTRTTYAVLYRDLDAAEAGEIKAILDDQGVKTRTQGSGTILVDERRVDDLSMSLASQGYPKSGFTYDIYEQASGFGMTDAEKETYWVFQIQDRLQNSISLFDGIKQAVVTLNIPRNNKAIFASEVTKPTASVMLVLQDGVTLSAENVSAIENLVASAVEGLEPADVTITDNRLIQLNSTNFEDFGTYETHYEFQQKVRDELARQVRNLLSPIFGAENVQVGVSATLDFDRESTEEIIFEPVVDDEGIVVSIHEIIEKATGTSGAGDVPGTDTNGALPAYPELTTGNMTDYSHITRDINYEVNEMHRVIEKAQGAIKELSVSVAINNTNLAADAGNADIVEDIVAGTLGLVRENIEGEDNRIRVQFLPFVEAEGDGLDGYVSTVRFQEMMGLIRTLALYILLFGSIIFLVIYTLRFFRKPEPALVLAGVGEEGEGGIFDLTIGEEDEAGIEVTKSKEREKIEEFIKRNPADVANLLRNWISE